MMTQELHKAQVSILRTLRHNPSARYTTLRRPTGLESDVFKFHLRKLLHQKYVRKLESGAYHLTPTGKEFANNLSDARRTAQKQPKLSVVIVASKDFDGTKKYLCQKRLRNPFYGFWGCLSGPVQWGESLEAAARREFEKQTGMTATYAVGSFYRETDYATDADAILEDKLFAVMKATEVVGEITNVWSKGLNAWMTLEELEMQDKYFTATRNFVKLLETRKSYQAGGVDYKQTEY